MSSERRVCEERKNKVYCYANEGSDTCAYCGVKMPVEKPREWMLHRDVGTECEVIRVHDADACDRLKAGGHGGACR